MDSLLMSSMVVTAPHRVHRRGGQGSARAQPAAWRARRCRFLMMVWVAGMAAPSRYHLGQGSPPVCDVSTAIGWIGTGDKRTTRRSGNLPTLFQALAPGP